MQKILNIDGHDVLLESNAATIFYYKEQFGHDFMRLEDGLRKYLES